MFIYCGEYTAKNRLFLVELRILHLSSSVVRVRRRTLHIAPDSDYPKKTCEGYRISSLISKAHLHVHLEGADRKDILCYIYEQGKVPIRGRNSVHRPDGRPSSVVVLPDNDRFVVNPQLRRTNTLGRSRGKYNFRI
jgi:hypothetical protein